MNDLLVDWEHESQKDYIFALERQKDIEASWQKEEQKPKVKIEIHELFNRNKSFRRTFKKIVSLRRINGLSLQERLDHENIEKSVLSDRRPETESQDISREK